MSYRTRCSMIAVALTICAAPLPASAAPQLQTSPAAAVGPSDRPANYGELTALWSDWRKFVLPAIKAYMPDYSVAAMAQKQAELPKYVARLKAIDTTGWSKSALIDYKLVQAEMNGLDFDFRVLMPWARDPTFYATVIADWSDVPAHEGPYAYPNIDLYKFKYPLGAKDAKTLTAMLAAVPGNLRAAKVNLNDSNAKDFFVYGDRAFKEQSATLTALAEGTLVMRTLDGHIPASAKGNAKLLATIAKAKAATDDFAAWVQAQAPKKTGSVGVGKENYNWHAANVLLIPYDWDQQVLLLRRELERSIASLRLEELRNRDLPPIAEIDDPAAYRKMAEAKAAFLSDFLVKSGFVSDKPYFKTALANQAGEYTPPEKRNFFSYITSLDPLPLQTHATHWIDLMRMREEPNASPIRKLPPLFNIYSNRSEGFATAFEEIVMQAGLYDTIPHGRELVWIALANRAARGLASLYVQSNEWDLAQAGKFHAEWTPRHWSDPESPLVGFEQLLYARQPGYGPSYVTGKLQLDALMAQASFEDDRANKPFVMSDFFAKVWAAGVIPVPLIEAEMTSEPLK
jgi:hypothetical protein